MDIDSLHDPSWMSKNVDETIEQAAAKVTGVGTTFTKKHRPLTKLEIFRQMVSQISTRNGHLDGQELATLFECFAARVREQVNCPNYDRLAVTALSVDHGVTATDFELEETSDAPAVIQPELLTQNCELDQEFFSADLTDLFPALQQMDIDHDRSSLIDLAVETPRRTENVSPIQHEPSRQSEGVQISGCSRTTQALRNLSKKRNRPSNIPIGRKKQKAFAPTCLPVIATQSCMQCLVVSREPSFEEANTLEERGRHRPHASQLQVGKVIFDDNLQASEGKHSISYGIKSCVQSMGDAQSLIELKRLIQQARQPTWNHARLTDEVDIGQRFSRIRYRGGAILYLMLQQWIDILLLYEDCAQEYPLRKSQFAIEAPRPSTRSVIKKRGNPFIAAESAVTDDILRRLRPDLEPGGCAWHRERDPIRRVCRLGSRLALLKAKFGEGAVCLVLIASVKFGLPSVAENHMYVDSIRMWPFTDSYQRIEDDRTTLQGIC